MWETECVPEKKCWSPIYLHFDSDFQTVACLHSEKDKSKNLKTKHNDTAYSSTIEDRILRKSSLTKQISRKD